MRNPIEFGRMYAAMAVATETTPNYPNLVDTAVLSVLLIDYYGPQWLCVFVASSSRSVGGRRSSMVRIVGADSLIVLRA